MSKVKKIIAREVLDSRGFPTVEAEVHLENGIEARAIVPSGASTGTYEALELRDVANKNRYMGKGVLQAIENIHSVIAPKLIGKTIGGIRAWDEQILCLDGSENKSELGANAILAVSLAGAHAAARLEGVTLAEWIHSEYKSFGVSKAPTLPLPLMNVINGGAHASNGLDVQEFMIVPHGFQSFSEALRAGAEIFHTLKKILSEKSLSTSVGDEGGFAPVLPGNEAALELLMRAVEKSGYRLGDQISFALDVAATEFYNKESAQYIFNDPSFGKLSSSELLDKYLAWTKKYPIMSIEDAFDEDDWSAWSEAQKKLKIQLVGDDLYVTQAARLKRGIEEKCSNAILIKFNQVGSLSETLETMALAEANELQNVISHRSGETEDSTLAHLVVGGSAGQVKTGSLSRSDRTAKYNELLRLEAKLGYPFYQWKQS